MMKLVGTFVLIVCTFLCCVKADNWDCLYTRYKDPQGYACILYGDSLEANETLIIAGDHSEDNDDADVHYVAFFDCDTTILPKGFTEKYPNLKYWKADYSDVKEIHPTSLTGATNLEKLSVRSNNIVRLEAETFIGAINLKELDLSDNELTFIHEHAFKKLTKLEELDFAANWIATLHKDIFADLVSLKKLSGFSNTIEDLPEGLFRNNLKLEEIELQNNNIKTIFPNSFKNLNNLKEVDVMFNMCTGQLFSAEDTALSTLDKELEKCSEANTWEAKIAVCQKKLDAKNNVHA